MPKKRNVLFLPSWFPNKNHPTLGIFVQRHAEAVSIYNNVAVLFVTSSEQDDLFIKEIETINNVLTIRVYYKKITSNIPVISGVQRFYRYLKAYFIGYQEILASFFKPDIVHLNVIFPAGIFALWLNMKHKIPVVISEHSSVYMPQDGRYKGFLMQWVTGAIIRKSKAVISISKNMKQYMLSHKLQGNYFVIPNVVDTTLFSPQEEELTNNGKFCFLHVSSINDREKNISGLIRIIDKLKDIRSDFYLNIIGDSIEKTLFEKMASEMGLLNTFIFFRGKQEPLKVSEYMRKADLFILFSNYEGLPCVLIEAFASGIPVVATSVGGIPELVNTSNGILVPVGNESAFLNAIQKVINNPQNYDAKLIRDYAVNNFSYERVGEEITKIYNEVLS